MNLLKRGSVILVGAAAIFLCASASGDEDIECGLRCLYVASVALGNESEYEELRQMAPVPATANGYSLAQLRDLADAMGYKTLLTTTDFQQLQARSQRQRFACIAWWREQHFVLFADFRKGQALVVDPPRKYWADGVVLKQKWDGQSLLLSTDPLLGEDELHQLSWTWVLAIGLGITMAVAGGYFAVFKRWS